MKQVVVADIDAPAGEIWPVLTDVERWPHWTPTMRQVRLLDTPPLGRGTRVQVRQPRLPTLTWVVDELTPGRCFSWITGVPGGRTRATHELVPVRDGTTRVVLAVQQTGIAALVGWVIRRLTLRYLDIEAASLRRRCEHPARRATSGIEPAAERESS